MAKGILQIQRMHVSDIVNSFELFRGAVYRAVVYVFAKAVKSSRAGVCQPGVLEAKPPPTDPFPGTPRRLKQPLSSSVAEPRLFQIEGGTRAIYPPILEHILRYPSPYS